MNDFFMFFFPTMSLCNNLGLNNTYVTLLITFHLVKSLLSYFLLSLCTQTFLVTFLIFLMLVQLCDGSVNVCAEQ